MRFDLREFVRWILNDFEPAVRVPGPAGSYARRRAERFAHVYGTADMACVLHTVGALRPTLSERAEWDETFAALQDPETGLFAAKPADHGVVHNTAFSLGAMNLLGLGPRHALRFAEPWRAVDDMRAVLDGLDWRNGVYSCSHDGAGIGSIAALAPGLVEPAWFDAYFAYLDARLDARNGMLGVEKPSGGDCDQIGGTFHYAFVREFFHRPFAHPEARIDAILGLQRPDGIWDEHNRWWLTLDALYMLSRAVGRSGHRRGEVEAAYGRALAECFAAVSSQPWREECTPHTLTAAVSIFAEAQNFLGAEMVQTDYPLQLVLDRRPFI